MPTGRALDDARGLLLEAGRRILAEDGARALTSRSVTEASGVAKGVLHRHFEDFDAYIAALVVGEVVRIREIEPRAADSASAAVADVIEQVFTPTMLGLVSLAIGRDGVRRRVSDGSCGIPLLGDATTAVADVLAAGGEVGWIRRDADVPVLALALTGSAYLLSAGGAGALPDQDTVEEFVQSILAASL
ncbi:TetR/AcrR family transcriptional regulator [Microbacterium trichothecenolyticum]|jgi:AcrR family transcriptional regulator|uniref:TetR/AcrR family transcriptional regulator n=1 Tax=Microbacterium trichothecenolyticum TaxID=69370 RepID=UPI0035BE4A38